MMTRDRLPVSPQEFDGAASTPAAVRRSRVARLAVVVAAVVGIAVFLAPLIGGVLLLKSCGDYVNMEPYGQHEVEERIAVACPNERWEIAASEAYETSGGEPGVRYTVRSLDRALTFTANSYVGYTGASDIKVKERLVSIDYAQQVYAYHRDEVVRLLAARGFTLTDDDTVMLDAQADIPAFTEVMVEAGDAMQAAEERYNTAAFYEEQLRPAIEVLCLVPVVGTDGSTVVGSTELRGGYVYLRAGQDAEELADELVQELIEAAEQRG